MTPRSEISASHYEKIVFQHSYFLLSRALDSFKLRYYNLAVFFGITAIEEITNNLYNVKEYENFDIKNFVSDFFPLASRILKEKDDVKNKEIKDKIEEIGKKYFDKAGTPAKLSIKELSAQFRMKEHKNHTKKTLKALIHSLSINPEAYRRLGSGFVEYYMFLAESGLIFKLRNLCLYVNVEKESISSPEVVIPKNMAVDIIAIAFESLIQLKGFGRSKEHAPIDKKRLRNKADEFYKENELKAMTYVGEITDFLSKKNVIIVKVIGKIALNDELVIYNSSQWKQLDKAISMEKNNQKITRAVNGDRIGIKIRNKVQRRGLLYRVQNDVGSVQKEGVIQIIDLFMEAEKTGQSPDRERMGELMNKSLRGIS